MPKVDFAALPEFLMRPGVTGKWIAGHERGSSALSVLFNTVEAGARIPRHYHAFEEVIIVEDGEIWVEVKDERLHIAPGQSAIVPPGAAHAWGNDGPATARVLFVWPVLEPFSPGKSTYLEGSPPHVS